MNIVLCANTSWYLYNFRKNLLCALQNCGYNVSVIAPKDVYSANFAEMAIQWFPLEMHQLRLNPVHECRVIAQLARHFRNIAPDVLFTYTIKCNVYAGLLKRVFPYKYVPTVSGLGQSFDGSGWMRHWVGKGYAKALRQAQTVFFQNNEDLTTFTQPYMLPESQCRRLPGSGVNLVEFTPSENEQPRNPRRFLMFGRLVPQKGYDLFLEVARRIWRERPGSAEFWILGIADSARNDSVELLQRIRTSHEQGLVTFLSEVADVRPILKQADVAVLPSQYHEGVPRSLLEAMACGKPLITTNWKGCRDTVEHGDNGLLVPPGDVNALYDAVQLLSEMPDNKFIQMGRASRRKAVQEFDERLVISAYLSELH